MRIEDPVLTNIFQRMPTAIYSGLLSPMTSASLGGATFAYLGNHLKIHRQIIFTKIPAFIK